MRYLDELLALYAGKDPFTRKFVLTQVLDHVPDQRSESIVALLWGEAADPDDVVSRQARYVLGQYLVRHTEHAFGLAGSEDLPGPGPARGTRFGAGGAGPRTPRDGTHASHAPAQGLAPHVFDGLAEPLRRVASLALEGSQGVRCAASLVMGRLWTRPIALDLASRTTGPTPDLMAACALAESDSPEGHRALLEAIEANGPRFPDLYTLLRGYPTPESLTCLEREEGRTDAQGRSNIAIALASHEGPACRPLLDRLVRRREGWVTAYALDTAAGRGDPDDLPLIEEAYALESHEFVRVHAVRAAGAIRSAAATEFCLARLREPSSRVRACALESLARQGMTGADLARLALPLIQGDLIKGRSLAVLLTARDHPDVSTAELMRWVESPEPLLRMEAASLLGHLEWPDSLGRLERIASSDPSVQVRCHAVRSLAEVATVAHAPEILLRHLVSDLAIVAEACRGLAAMAVAGVAVPAQALVETAGRAGGPAVRAALLQCLGAVAAAQGAAVPPALTHALEDPETMVVLGALEGLKMMAAAAPLEAARSLTGHPDARVRARASLVAFLTGGLDEVGVLTDLLKCDNEQAHMAALDAMLQIGLLLPLAPRSPRLSALLGRSDTEARKEAPPTPTAIEIGSVSPWRPTAAAVRRTSAVTALTPDQVRRAGVTPPVSTPKVSPVAGAEPARSPGRGASRPVRAISRPVPRSIIDAPCAPAAGAAAAQDLVGGMHVAIARALDGLQAWGARASPVARGAGSRMVRLAPPWAWALLAAAVLGAAPVFLRGSRGPPDVPLERGHAFGGSSYGYLRVWSLRPPCHHGPPGVQGVPMAAGDLVAVGERVSVGPGGRLRLQDRAGNAITLGASSGIVLRAAIVVEGRRVRYTLEDPRGECGLDLAGDPQLEVKVGRSTITLRHAVGRLEENPSGRRLTVVSGQASLDVPGREPWVLTKGQRAILP